MNKRASEAEDRTAKLFLDFSRRKLLGQYWPRLRHAIESLTNEQVWWRSNESSNSIGNLVLHLNGNVRQWLVTSFDRLEDERDRPAEFSAREGIPPAALTELLAYTMEEAKRVLSRLTLTDLLETYRIQGYTVSGLDAVFQVVEHFGMHYGQIIYITKMLTDQDLEFYKELTHTGRSSGATNY